MVFFMKNKKILRRNLHSTTMPWLISSETASHSFSEKDCSNIFDTAPEGVQGEDRFNECFSLIFFEIESVWSDFEFVTLMGLNDTMSQRCILSTDSKKEKVKDMVGSGGKLMTMTVASEQA